LAIHGERAFVGNLYDASFQVFDVSNPAVPSELASFTEWFPHESWDVVVEGDRAFIVDYFMGIIITDISDISELEIVGYYQTAPFFVGLEVTNDRAYTLGQEYFGYAVLDISDPTDPRFLGKSHDGHLRFPRGIVARDHLGYIANRGLFIGDLQDPEAPELISQLAVPGITRAVRVRGDYAYLTSDHSGFHVIDISDMASPTLAGVVEMPGFSYGLALKGDHAFVANSEFGLKVIDISDPTAPTLVASLQTPDNAYDVRISGDLAYLADGMSGLHVVDISDPEAPTIIGSLDLGGFINSVAVKGDFAFVTDEDFGVRKIDISDPTAPVLVASYDTPGEPTDVATFGDYVIVNDAFSIIVLR
jgi:hypothetical protein